MKDWGPYVPPKPFANLSKERYLAAKQKQMRRTAGAWILVAALGFVGFDYLSKHPETLQQTASQNPPQQVPVQKLPACVIAPRNTLLYGDMVERDPRHGMLSRDERLPVIGGGHGRLQVQRLPSLNPNNQPTFVDATKVTPC